MTACRLFQADRPEERDQSKPQQMVLPTPLWNFPHQLSKDHTLAAELIEGGMMTAEMAKDSRYHSVLTRAIGQHQVVKPDILLLDVLPGDRFLLCSDGMSEYIADESWLARAMGASGDDLEELTDMLVAHANECGGSDNIGVVVVRVEGVEAERPLKVGLFQRLRQRFGRNRSHAVNDVAARNVTGELLKPAELI